MGRFNQSAVTKPKRTTNLAGGPSWVESPQLELVSLMLTSFVQDQYYRKGDDQSERLVKLIDQVDPKFAAKAAIYGRREFGMRSITHVAAAHLARKARGQKWTRDFFYSVVERPDDMSEILALYFSLFGTKRPDGKYRHIPNALKDGLALAFNKFGNYQIAKYQMQDKQVSLLDLVNLLHPHPTAQNQEALAQLIAGTIKPAETWEAGLTAAGQSAENEEDKAEKKAEVWSKLLEEDKLGYFAILRNLRNILSQAINLVPTVCVKLEDRERIKHSKVLPFRFITAIQVIDKWEAKDTESRQARDLVIQSLKHALEIAVDNVPEYAGRTVVVLDESGSMGNFGDPKSPLTTGALFAAVLSKANRAHFVAFANEARPVTVDYYLGVYELAKKLSTVTSGGTNLNCVFPALTEKYDRIIILSDMQTWVEHHTPRRELEDYKKRTGADPKIFSFDLSGYGTLQFQEKNVYAIAGFHEKVLDLLQLLEQDREALVHAIEQVDLTARRYTRVNSGILVEVAATPLSPDAY